MFIEKHSPENFGVLNKMTGNLSEPFMKEESCIHENTQLDDFSALHEMYKSDENYHFGKYGNENTIEPIEEQEEELLNEDWEQDYQEAEELFINDNSEIDCL